MDGRDLPGTRARAAGGVEAPRRLRAPGMALSPLRTGAERRLEPGMIISIASGKGGTGKTTVAVNLALTLARTGRVQIADADVEEPNVHTFLHPQLEGCHDVCLAVPTVDEDKCTFCGRCAEVCAFNAIVAIGETVLVLPQLCHGCGGCARLCPSGAISESQRPLGIVEWGTARGMGFIHGRLNVGEAISPPIISELKSRIRPDRIVIIDSAPGTSCPMVAALRGSDFCLLVTEPTPFGLSDLILAVDVTRRMGIPAAVVINRDGTGDGRVDRYVEAENLPVLARLPFDLDLAGTCARGELACEVLPEWERRFSALARELRRLAGRGERTGT